MTVTVRSAFTERVHTEYFISFGSKFKIGYSMIGYA